MWINNQITTSVPDLVVMSDNQKKGSRSTGTTEERKKDGELPRTASKIKYVFNGMKIKIKPE